jgi:acyl-CoA dehydrogenase
MLTLITKNGKIMSFQSTLDAIKERAEKASTFGNTLKFDFGDKQVFLDGTGDSNTVSTEDKDADCTIKIEQSDFESILRGDMDPMSAFMSGKIKVEGDMGVAMKLQSLLA